MDKKTYKVLDTSIVLKWFIHEDNSDKALVYLENYSRGEFAIIIPTLLFYELGNALLYNKALPKDIQEIMVRLQALYLETVNIGYDGSQKVFQNAKEYNISFYDASYITLMQQKDCEFITADKKLYEKVGKKLSGVTLL